MCRRSQDRRSYLQLFTLQDKDALRRFEKLRSKLQFLLRFKPVAIRESLALENTQVTISPCSDGARLVLDSVPALLYKNTLSEVIKI